MENTPVTPPAAGHQPGTGSEPDPRTAPAPLAWAEGLILPAALATVPLTDEGFLRGDAVFEAVLVRAGRTHALEPHLARLQRSAAAVQLPVDDARVREVIDQLRAAWGPHDGSIKVIVTRGGALRGLIGPVQWPSSISLGVVEMPWRTALSGVKTLSYAANQWALRQARALGADDAIIVDDGIVHELPSGAVVLIEGGTCSTPDPDRLPILASVSVAALREIVEVRPAQPSLDDLLTADEVTVLSATRPCLPVHALLLADGRRIDLAAPGPVSDRLRRALDDHIARTLDPAPSVRSVSGSSEVGRH